MSTKRNVDYTAKMENGEQVLIETVSYGTNLKEILKENNLSVAELSRKTGVPPTTLYSTISRNTAMRYEHALRISKYLNMGIDQFTNHIPEENHDEIVFTVNRANISQDMENKIREVLKEIETETDTKQQKRLLSYLENMHDICSRKNEAQN